MSCLEVSLLHNYKTVVSADIATPCCMQIHSRKMNVRPDVNFEELARSTDDFNGAQLKAVCIEAGMLALRRDATEVVCLAINAPLFVLCVLYHLCLTSLKYDGSRSHMKISTMVSFKSKRRRRPA